LSVFQWCSEREGQQKGSDCLSIQEGAAKMGDKEASGISQILGKGRGTNLQSSPGDDAISLE